MKGEVLTVDHPLWEEFSRRLSGPEGCDFRFHAGKGYTWICKHGDNRDLATAILRTMPGIDVDGTLAYLGARYLSCSRQVSQIPSRRISTLSIVPGKVDSRGAMSTRGLPGLRHSILPQPVQ